MVCSPNVLGEGAGAAGHRGPASKHTQSEIGAFSGRSSGHISGVMCAAHVHLLCSCRDGAVATTEIVRRPGETETALRLLLHQLKIMKLPAELASNPRMYRCVFDVLCSAVSMQFATF